MLSNQTKEQVEIIKNLIKENGASLEYADGLYQYGKYAMYQEDEKDFALDCFKVAKKCIEKVIEVQTQGGDWEWLDEWCVENNTTSEPTELYYKILFEEAEYNFESFCYYMEQRRKPDKRFYMPRASVLRYVARDLMDLENRKGNMRFYGLSMPPRVGKLVADNTPILTKNGWKNHGDLRVGDYVVGRDGEWVKVTYVHPKHYANKRVWFSDHTYIDCHENHEWLVYDRSKNKECIVETKELVKSEYREGDKTRYRFQMPLIEPMQGSYKDLKVDPYILGVWLGDGTNRKPVVTICNTDDVILGEMIAHGYLVTNCYEQIGCKAYHFSNLRADLQKYGMCHSRNATQKHIPEEYFTADLSQRLDLLAGLIDTDGCLRVKENRYDIATADENLKNDIVRLISTFGWRVCVCDYEPTLSTGGIQGKKPCYTISFNPTTEIPCRVPRKQLKEFSKQRRIAITHVEDIEPIQGNCITVEGGLYRAGHSMKLTHNSTICLFFLAWIACKRPNSHNAAGGHSSTLMNGFFKELTNLMTTQEYNFKELYFHMHPEYADKKFPTHVSAEYTSITLGDPDRFPTIVARGYEATWTGAIDVSSDGYLYIDDLIKNREESLSPERMEKVFQAYANEMLDRTNTGSRQLMVGTLWSVIDPLERLRVAREDDPRYRFRRIPALNDNDESNFQYRRHGFSSEHYIEMRETLDPPEWYAKFLQKPFVREGLVLPLDSLNYFSGIMPEGDYRIISACDCSFGGGDNLSMPIAREYANGDVYVFDWIHNSGAKEVTLPLVTGKIMENEIRQIQFEGNQGGDMYADYVDKELGAQGYKCAITSKRAPNNMAKMEKIIAYAGDIKRNYYFLTPKKQTPEEIEKDKELGIKRYVRSKEYQNAMDEIGMVVSVGRNTHEDAIDALTQLEMFREGGSGRAKIEVIKNPFKSSNIWSRW